MSKATKREPKLDMLVDAYDAVLLQQRITERDLLNKKRDAEIQYNRPPSKGWYALKSQQFFDELRKNRVTMNPNSHVREYLQILEDSALY